ncbi:hypothetical protein NN561_006217 [Cricetulus griseus]
MPTPSQDFHILHQLHLAGNSRNCVTGIHNPCSVTVPPAQGLLGARGGDPGAGVPARRPRLPKAQVQLSLMALYLLPDASLCSFLRISSILAFPEPGHRPGECAEDSPRRLLSSSPSRSAATDESRPFHAAGHVSPAATPLATPAGSGALPSQGTLEAGAAYFAPKRTWGTRLFKGRGR